MPKLLNQKEDKVESTIPKWVVYSLFGTVSFLVVNSIHSAFLTLIVSGAVMLFIWSYLSKPIAEIQPIKEDNIFDKKKRKETTWKNPSEPNAQRKRYLKSITNIDKAA